MKVLPRRRPHPPSQPRPFASPVSPFAMLSVVGDRSRVGRCLLFDMRSMSQLNKFFTARYVSARCPSANVAPFWGRRCVCAVDWLVARAPEPVTAVCSSKSGRIIFTGYADSKLKAWDSMKRQTELQVPPSAHVAARHP